MAAARTRLIHSQPVERLEKSRFRATVGNTRRQRINGGNILREAIKATHLAVDGHSFAHGQAAVVWGLVSHRPLQGSAGVNRVGQATATALKVDAAPQHAHGICRITTCLLQTSKLPSIIRP